MNPDNKPVYRLLEEGEKLQKGDQIWCFGAWDSFVEKHRDEVRNGEIWRRKIEDQPKEASVECLKTIAQCNIQAAININEQLKASEKKVEELKDHLYEKELILGLADKIIEKVLAAQSEGFSYVSATLSGQIADAVIAYQKARHPEPMKPREWWLEIRSNGSVFAHDRAPNFVSLDSRIVHTREIVPSAEDVSTPPNPS